MDKITFEDFERVMSYDLNKKQEQGIEVNFFVDGCTTYLESWMGKMIDRDTKMDCYWFGLVPDGSQAYDFDSFDAFVNAKVFYGDKSLKDVWNTVSLYSLGGGPADDMLPYFSRD